MDPDKFVERKAKRPEHDPEKRKRRKSLKASRKQEDRLAGKLGGRRQSGSGAAKAPVRGGPYMRQRKEKIRGKIKEGGRGDVDAGRLKVEAKSTSKKSIGIKMEWLEKVYLEALMSNKSPGLALTFERRSDTPGFPADWIAVPVEWLQVVLEKAGLTELDGDSA